VQRDNLVVFKGYSGLVELILSWPKFLDFFIASSMLSP
jgi:hypothetical protein